MRKVLLALLLCLVGVAHADITGVTITTITDTSATVVFDTDVVGDFTADAYTDPACGVHLGVWRNSNYVTHHSIVLGSGPTTGPALSPSTHYCLTVTSSNVSGDQIACATDCFITFMTLAAPTATVTNTPFVTSTPTVTTVPTSAARTQNDNFILSAAAPQTYTVRLSDKAMPDSLFICSFLNGTVSALTLNKGTIQNVAFGSLASSADPCFNATFLSPCVGVRDYILKIEDTRGRLLNGVNYQGQVSYMTNDVAHTATPTITITFSPTATPTYTRTVTPTRSPTLTKTAENTKTPTRTLTVTATPTRSPTPSSTRTATATPTWSPSVTKTSTTTQTVTVTPTRTATSILPTATATP